VHDALSELQEQLSALSEGKADADKTEAALESKAERRLMANKADRSFCEGLLARFAVEARRRAHAQHAATPMHAQTQHAATFTHAHAQHAATPTHAQTQYAATFTHAHTHTPSTPPHPRTHKPSISLTRTDGWGRVPSLLLGGAVRLPFMWA
jgi:hypothetical protein